DDSGDGMYGIGTEMAGMSGQKCADLIITDKLKKN
ncbi:unnamed protein product, partial [marine sediment metagenome]